jgi:hypothetical protein
MKSLFLLLVFINLVFFTQAQAKTFSFNGANYEYEFSERDATHFQFSICKSETNTKTNTRSCDKIYSDYLTKDLDENLFNAEFDKIMKALDAKYSIAVADTAIKNKYDTSRKGFYTAAKTKAGEKTDTEKKVEELTDRVDKFLKADDKNKQVGELYLVNTKVRIYEGPKSEDLSSIIKNKKDTLQTIKDVQVTIVKGAIIKKGLVVNFEDGTIFMNRGYPFSFARFFKRKNTRLYINDSHSNKFILFGDLLEYKHFGALVYPGDKEVTLDYKKQRDTLIVGSSLNQFLNVNVYTDLLGLIGGKPNGLIQTEVSSHIISNTANIKYTDIVVNNYVEPYMRVSKFDSKFSSLDSPYYAKGPGGKDTVNRTYLNQIAYLQAGVKANLLKIGIGINQELYLNLGVDINLVSGDSIKSYKKDITFFNWYPELIYKITRLNNFGMEASLKLLKQRLGGSAPFVNNSAETIFNPTVSLFYYPDNDDTQKIYLRFSYYDNRGDGKYNFAQFQLGYKTNLKFK